MAMTREEACGVLGVPVGADMRQIVDQYKYLGKEYHPQHKPNDPNAAKKFSRLSIAYATLKGSRKKAAKMSLEQMLRQFQEVFFQRNLDALNGAVASSSDEADDDDLDGDGDEEEEEEDDDDNEGYTEEDNRTSEISNHRRTEDASPNITEEEKERKKAEKRRLKKKRQKERKKLEKQSNKNQPQSQTTVRVKSPEIETKRKPEPKISDPSSEEDGELDQEAAFVMEAKKKKAKQQAEAPKKKKEKTIVPPKPVELVDDTEPRVLRSRKLAIRGNEMAQVQQYSAATELFTEAISLDPRDFRFFGNRSFCYDRMQQYEKALKDAERAIELNSNWAKGYFRQGRALTGLKRFPDAEKSFLQVLKLDPQCSDAIQELFNVRVHQLMEMGFSKLASENAIRVHDNVQVALESLLAGGMGDLQTEDEECSDEEEFQVQYSKHTLQQHQKQQAAADVKMKWMQLQKKTENHDLLIPTNPEGLTALWVGNILPQVTEKKLLPMFQRYGQVTSVRMLHEKYCAFINFSTPESAGLAMQKLQGVECEGQHLLIKFPDNPITANGNITLRKPAAAAAASKQGLREETEVNGVKKRGPVNGDECYFWRTTGCSYGKHCRNKHIPEHKEIDKKNWQKA